MQIGIIFNGSKACIKIHYNNIKHVLLLDAKDAIKVCFELVDIHEKYLLDAILFYEKHNVFEHFIIL